ncbi:hypothetical protein [Aquimarina sp. RZ0]|uniref:hypothetical protein n=1 Tax=Aquimarina sp. RZ0 TaxID=2607730 RepID=UPI0011F3CD4B|nr:hypothetical protein [Aquimarina sp. RZ0]KAA1248164.1 hypothetical protein F0000_00780 [Aquimarina sp. RZ0]
MKTATVRELKKELGSISQEELVELCIRLSKFKKENKELLTYLLYEASNEERYIAEVKQEIGALFLEINTNNFYYIKKSVRKILRITRKYIRYSGKKETEVELLIFFCSELKNIKPSIQENTALFNLYTRQLIGIRKVMSVLHEDLQYDFEMMLQDI